MKPIESKASIVIKSQGITYNICSLIQRIEGDSFSYTFIPNREVIDLLPPNIFEGIQGVDLDVKKEKYERSGIPTFVSERVPPKNREGLFELLQKVGLDYYDPLQYMLRSKETYFGDNLVVVDFIQKQTVDISYSNITNLYSTVKKVVENLALDNEVTLDGVLIENKKEYFEMLYPVYLNLYLKKVAVQNKSSSIRKYEGRKPISINESEFKQVLDLYKKKQITLNEASNILNISRSTFIRRANAFQN